MGALLYALKALEAAGCTADSELKSQLEKLPDNLREPIVSGLMVRMAPLGIQAAIERKQT